MYLLERGRAEFRCSFKTAKSQNRFVYLLERGRAEFRCCFKMTRAKTVSVTMINRHGVSKRQKEKTLGEQKDMKSLSTPDMSDILLMH